MSVTLNHHFIGATQGSVKFLGTLGLILVAFTAWSEPPEPATGETPAIHQDADKEDAKNNPTSPSGLPPLLQNQLARDKLLAETVLIPTPFWLQYQQTALLGFWSDNQDKHPKGAVLILPNPGEPPLTNRLLANLMQNLPKHGWAILALTLPEAPGPFVPARQKSIAPPQPQDEAPSKVDETQVVHDDSEPKAPVEVNIAPQITWQEYEANMTTAIQAGIEELKSRGQYNIALIGEGTGAYLALRYLQTNQNQNSGVTRLESQTQTAVIPQNVGALVMVNYRQPSEATPDSLFTEPGTLTLDAYVADLKGTREAAQQRYLEASKFGYTTYLQKPLTLNTLSANPEGTVKSIRGFLNRYVAGKEFK